MHTYVHPYLRLQVIAVWRASQRVDFRSTDSPALGSQHGTLKDCAHAARGWRRSRDRNVGHVHHGPADRDSQWSFALSR